MFYSRISIRGLYDFTCDHAECNAHILRYLKAAIESKKRVWAEDMIKLLLEAKEEVEDNNGKPLGKSAVLKIRRRYDKILERGGREFLKDESPDYNGESLKQPDNLPPQRQVQQSRPSADGQKNRSKNYAGAIEGTSSLMI
jgi:hypothetical protein